MICEPSLSPAGQPSPVPTTIPVAFDAADSADRENSWACLQQVAAELSAIERERQAGILAGDELVERCLRLWYELQELTDRIRRSEHLGGG